MAPMSIAAARKAAEKAGFTRTEIRGKTMAQLSRMIGNGDKPKPRKKAAVAKAVSAPVRRGRPPVRKSASSKSAPAAKSRATGGKAKRPTATKRTVTASTYVPKGGRNVLGKLDYTLTDGWNPRVESAPDLILRALRKAKGNRERAFEILVPNPGKISSYDVFMSRTKTNGEKRTVAEAKAMMKYRIARTEWDFAMRTGQHEKATNRVGYGSSNGTATPAKSRARVKTAAAKGSTVKRGPGRPKTAAAKSKTKSASSAVKRTPVRRAKVASKRATARR